MNSKIRWRISSAVAVRWTPALAERVGQRIEHRLARARRRRRVALIALALVGTTGVAFAFSQRWIPLRARSPAPAATAFTARAATASTAPAAPPERAPPLPAPRPPERVSRSQAKPTRHTASAVRAVPPPESVASLFAAADAARLAGRPTDAVAPLTAIFSHHPRDPRAAVAAYQLGRVLDFDLHDRTGAAAAFARAHDLDPSGPLAADAAAHAAEARAAREQAK